MLVLRTGALQGRMVVRVGRGDGRVEGLFVGALGLAVGVVEGERVPGLASVSTRLAVHP